MNFENHFLHRTLIFIVVLCSGLTNLANADPNLVLRYKLNESSGDTVFDSSGDYNGVMDGNQWFWDPCGRDGGCLDFNGHGKLFADPCVWPELDSNNLTVSVWLRMDPCASTPWIGTIFAAGDTWPPCMGVRFWDGNLVIWGGPSFASQYWHTWGLSADTLAEMKGRWHHFAFVKDHNASTVKTYYDGKPVMTAANTYDRWGNIAYGGKLTIGCPYAEWEPLEGKMDDFRIYSRALSEPEILHLAGLAIAYNPQPDRRHLHRRRE